MNILYLKSSNFNFVCILFLSKTRFISTMNVMLRPQDPKNKNNNNDFIIFYYIKDIDSNVL